MTQPLGPPPPTHRPAPAPAAAQPPATPPRGVRQPLLWRLAVCVCRDHVPLRLGTRVLCACCGAPWPCRSRRLAAQALTRAYDDPGPGGARRRVR